MHDPLTTYVIGQQQQTLNSLAADVREIKANTTSIRSSLDAIKRWGLAAALWVSGLGMVVFQNQLAELAVTVAKSMLR